MSRSFSLLNPVYDLTRAVVMPLKALFVVGLCAVINAMTYSGTWWVKWVALGMGIAVIASLARAARSLLLLAVTAWVGWKIYQRYGAQARARFDEWVATQQPQAAAVLNSVRHFGA